MIYLQFITSVLRKHYYEYNKYHSEYYEQIIIRKAVDVVKAKIKYMFYISSII